MNSKTNPPDKPQTAKGGDRKARLATELRANLARRKAQSRSRRAGEGDARPDGLGEASAGRDTGGDANPKDA
jgi:hypothetical protein